jgi:hypothetical protein
MYYEITLPAWKVSKELLKWKVVYGKLYPCEYKFVLGSSSTWNILNIVSYYFWKVPKFGKHYIFSKDNDYKRYEDGKPSYTLPWNAARWFKGMRKVYNMRARVWMRLFWP